MIQDSPVDAFIDEQPQIIAETLHAVRTRASGWSAGDFDGIVLVGSGSSFNALTVAASAFAAAGRGSVRVLGPTSFRGTPAGLLPRRHLVVVLSQTGTSTTTIEAATEAHAAGQATLIVTAEAESPMAAVGAPMIVLPVGPEPVGPKTKGYTASIAGLHAIAERIGGPAIPPFDPGAMANLITGSRSAAEDLASRFGALDYVLIGGEGDQLGTALEASLKIAEIAGVPTAAFETEEILHGRLHGLTANSLCLLATTTTGQREVGLRTAAAMAKRGVAVRLLNLSGVPTQFDWPQGLFWPSTTLAPLAAIIPAQCLAAALARRRGLEPHAMRYPGLSADLAIKRGPSE